MFLSIAVRMDTLVAENYLYDNAIHPQDLDGDRHVFRQKSITPIIDQQRGSGSYSTGRIVIDAQAFGNSSEYVDWANAYLSIPEVVTVSGVASATLTLAKSLNPNYLSAPKNNALIESVRIERGGETLVQESQNLAHLVNFTKHCTVTQESLEKDVGTTLYYPDSSGAWFTATGLTGTCNTSNSSAAIDADVASSYSEGFNSGLLKRQQASFPLNTLTNAFSSTTFQQNEMAPVQKVAKFTTIATTATPMSEIHRVRIVYLRDLSDLIAKMPLSRGVGFKLTLVVNQATSSIVLTPSSSVNPLSVTPVPTATTLVGGATCQPNMLCFGPKTLAGDYTATSYSGTVTITLTSAIDTSVDSRQQGCILYVPSYTIAPSYEAKLLANPVIHRSPYLVNSSVYQGMSSNAPINLQLFSAVTNPRALIVIPQYGQTAQGQVSQCSPTNPCPGTSDPTLSLTKTQIRLNSRAILPSPVNYGFTQFIENTSRIFAMNGGQSPVTSGIIDMSKFMQNYRYYAFDLGYLADDQRDVPQLISFESFNNSSVAIDLYVFVLYEKSVTFDLLKGTIDMK